MTSANDFLDLIGKHVLVTGLSNKRSVAHFIAKGLKEAGALPIFSVRTEERRESIKKLVGDSPVFICDVSDEAQIQKLGEDLKAFAPLAGVVHSIAFANYEDGFKPFVETPRADFLAAMQVSCFSFVELANALRPCLADDASLVTISISSTTMAAENYGYMAPIKAALDSSVVFLAQSLGTTSDVRVNSVRAGLLKTRSSAGIPGYADAYLYGEQATLRGKGVTTEEVASTALFLLSPRSSGINAQGLVVDAGMASGYFKKDLVRKATAPE
ncbi:MAG: SDR family oxidoreductase [Planctomycetes bacterium]|nr:SDR family oxidoreductase [Planctomycetota bacterium]